MKGHKVAFCRWATCLKSPPDDFEGEMLKNVYTLEAKNYIILIFLNKDVMKNF